MTEIYNVTNISLDGLVDEDYELDYFKSLADSE